MDTQKAVEELRVIIEDGLWLDRLSSEDIARRILDRGYIPKESALEFVELCSCVDKDFIKSLSCSKCKGAGIIMRKEKQ